MMPKVRLPSRPLSNPNRGEGNGGKMEKKIIKMKKKLLWVRDKRNHRSRRIPCSNPGGGFTIIDKSNVPYHEDYDSKDSTDSDTDGDYIFEWEEDDDDDYNNKQLPSRTLYFRLWRPVPWSSRKLRPLSKAAFSSLHPQDCLQDDKLHRYLLSCAEVNDDGSKTIVEKFATIVLKEWNEGGGTSFDLVESGPIAVGYGSVGHILHMNFKAKDNDAPDASVQTFFIEVTINNRNVVTFVNDDLLGPSSSLPDKADTFGCLYCSSHNIHHPDNCYEDTFHNGREDHLRMLRLQSKKLRAFLSKSVKEGFSPRFSHHGIKYFGNYFQHTPSNFANVALSLFNSGKKGRNYELVKTRSSGGSFMDLGFVVHLNFEAENKDDLNAPLQTFFAEVICYNFYAFATLCECLGPADSILPEEANLYGCALCEFGSVHHPRSPWYLNGREFNV